MKRILLTGGGGFIGRNFIEFFSSSYEVVAPLRSELDLLDEAAVRRYVRLHPADAVVHCAVTPGHRNSRWTEQIANRNLRMFFNLVNNRDRFGKLILLGSGAEYDMRHYRPKMTEECFGEHIPIDESGFSKYAIARYAEACDDVVLLRPFGVFGRYEDYEIRFISNAICKTLLDLPITIKQNRRFDYVDVFDLSRVVRHFVENKPRHKAYNVTPDSSIELRTLAEMVLDAAGKKLDIVTALPEMGIEYSGDNSRLRSEIPHFNWTPLRESIGALYEWYEENRRLVRGELLLLDK